jgi:8-oxo-dGTP pyrophosphatase MutT (NUDIX family)
MAVTPKLSATVVLVRPGSADSDPWETYLLRRGSASPVLADMWVFPGGTLREDDLAAAAEGGEDAFGPSYAHGVFSRAPDVAPATPVESFAHFIAAERELIEEAGIVLTSAGKRWPPPSFQPERFASQREELEKGRRLGDFMKETGIAIAPERLTYYAHWITPEAIPQRFDTRFFLARLPDGQEATPSPYEMAEGLWISASDALERAKAGTLSLHFATLNHLKRLAPFRTIEELLAFAATKPVLPVMPETRENDGRPVPFLSPEIEGNW